MVAVLLTLIVGVAGTDVWLLSQRNVATKVGVDEVVADFRAQTGGPAAATPAAAGTDAVAPVAAPVADGETAAAPPVTEAEAEADVARESAGPVPAPPAPGETGPAVPASAPPAAAPPGAAPAAYALPAEGVYTYRAAGHEQISVVGARHQYPDRIHATVRHLGGCGWEHRARVLREHEDMRVMCSEPGRLLQVEQVREVEFFAKRDKVHFRCEPPQLQHDVSEAPGTVTLAECADGQGNRVRMERTFVGREAVTVGGRQVEAVRIRIDGSFTGKATGTSVDHLWMAPDTGMTLRWDRTVDTLADAAFGAQVRYQEDASFVLESLTPQT